MGNNLYHTKCPKTLKKNPWIQQLWGLNHWPHGNSNLIHWAILKLTYPYYTSFKVSTSYSFLLHVILLLFSSKVLSFLVICSKNFSYLLSGQAALCGSHLVMSHLWQWHRLLLWVWAINMNMKWQLKLRRYMFNCSSYLQIIDWVNFDSYMGKNILNWLRII